MKFKMKRKLVNALKAIFVFTFVLSAIMNIWAGCVFRSRLDGWRRREDAIRKMLSPDDLLGLKTKLGGRVCYADAGVAIATTEDGNFMFNAPLNGDAVGFASVSGMGATGNRPWNVRWQRGYLLTTRSFFVGWHYDREGNCGNVTLQFNGRKFHDAFGSGRLVRGNHDSRLFYMLKAMETVVRGRKNFSENCFLPWMEYRTQLLNCVAD